MSNSMLRAGCCCACIDCDDCGYGGEAPCSGDGLLGTTYGGALPAPCWWYVDIQDLVACPEYPAFTVDNGQFWVPRLVGPWDGCDWTGTFSAPAYGWTPLSQTFYVNVHVEEVMAPADEYCDSDLYYWWVRCSVESSASGLYAFFYQSWYWDEEVYTEQSCTEFNGANQLVCGTPGFPYSNTGTCNCVPWFTRSHPATPP